MLSCKGECHTKFRSSLGNSVLRYMYGQKRCSVCTVYFKWDGSKCPCCNAILHVRPRHSKAKEKYYQIDGINGSKRL